MDVLFLVLALALPVVVAALAANQAQFGRFGGNQAAEASEAAAAPPRAVPAAWSVALRGALGALVCVFLATLNQLTRPYFSWGNYLPDLLAGVALGALAAPLHAAELWWRRRPAGWRRLLGVFVSGALISALWLPLVLVYHAYWQGLADGGPSQGVQVALEGATRLVHQGDPGLLLVLATQAGVALVERVRGRPQREQVAAQLLVALVSLVVASGASNLFVPWTGTAFPGLAYVALARYADRLERSRLEPPSPAS